MFLFFLRRSHVTSELKDEKELVLQREMGRAFQQHLWVRLGNLLLLCFLGASNEGAPDLDEVLVR